MNLANYLLLIQQHKNVGVLISNFLMIWFYHYFRVTPMLHLEFISVYLLLFKFWRWIKKFGSTFKCILVANLLTKSHLNVSYLKYYWWEAFSVRKIDVCMAFFAIGTRMLFYFLVLIMIKWNIVLRFLI